MTRILTTLLFSLLVGAVASQEASNMSLREALAYALDNHRSIKNAQLNVEDADQQIIERRATGLPQLNGGIDYQYYFKVPVSVLPEQFEEIIRIGNGGMLPDNYSPQAAFAFKNNFNFNLSMNTMIFEGSYFIGLRAARLYREYANQELVAVKKDLQTKVVEAYLPCLIIVESLKTLDKNIGNLEKMLLETRETYKAGFIEQLDVDRLELSLANLKIEQENLKRQKEVTLNFLKFTIGYPIDDPLDITDKIDDLLEDVTQEELTGNINFFSRPEYKVAEMGVSLNQMNVDYSRSFYLPSLSGFANYQYGYQGNRLFDEGGFWAPLALAGIKLNVPIFDGFDKKAKVQRNRIALAIAQNQKQDLERVITLEVQNARTQYYSAKERVNSQQKNLELAERIYETTQVKYKEGVGSSLEVTQAEQALYQTQQNHIQALYELLITKSQLYKALGK